MNGLKKRNFVMLWAAVFGTLVFAAQAAAKTEWDAGRTFQLEAVPLDVAASPKGSWVFVLMDGGVVKIFAADGTLKDTIEIGKHVDGIRAGSREDELLLISKKQRTVQRIALRFQYDIDISGSPFKGAADAPVVIAVFDDFQCPYCARLLPLFEQVLKAYPGKVKLVAKNFPLRSHKFAFKASEAALAAGKSGKYWEFHDKLFENQRKISDPEIKRIAGELGFEWKDFEKQMSDPAIKTRIRKDLQEGRRIGVRGTPTIFVNGRRLNNRSMDGFRSMIDRELKELGQ